MMTNFQRVMLSIGLIVLVMFLSSCVPAPAGGQLPTSQPPTTEAAPAANNQAGVDSGATATVTTRSLRVRAQPSNNGEVIVGIKEGEKYPVIGISSDGLWVQLAIDTAPGGSGWVNANFVSVAGSISETETMSAPQSSTPVSGTVPISGTTPNITANVTPAAGFALVRTEGTRLRVRTEPTAEAPIVGYIYDGEQYQVLETSADGQWVKIPGSGDAVSDNPQGGWVSVQYLVIGQ